MIQHTFCHLQGIGEKTERQLWDAGLTCWDEALGASLPGKLAWLPDRLHASVEALADRDWSHFRSVLSGRHAWRWFDLLRDRCLYLDIETTGGPAGYDAVTVIACYDGREATCFIRDVNLGEFPTYAAGFDLLVTYNGLPFDAPHLRAQFPGLRLPPVHLDLRYPLANLGYKGGLKRVELDTGFARDDGLEGVDGLMAIALWYQHLRGDARALPTLVRYAVEDVLGLEPLAELVYNLASEPLPVPNPILGPTARRVLDLPYSPELLGELRQGWA